MTETAAAMKYKSAYWHVLLWVGLYLFWISAFHNAAITISRSLQIQLCYLVFIAVNFYYNIYFAIPRQLNAKKYFPFAAGSSAFLLISAYLRAQLVVFINGTFYNITAAQINFRQLYADSLLNIAVWSLGLIAVKLIIDRARFQQYALTIEKEKVKSELDFLRAQHNPHFLFNALNSVYFQIDKNNREARESLMTLSEILRYQLYECSDAEVPVEKELSFLKNYVHLQRMRLNAGFDISFTISGAENGWTIAPLLLMPLAENAFKYVSHRGDKPNVIRIEIAFEKNSFSYKVYNTAEKRPLKGAQRLDFGITNADSGPSPANGIGLKNLGRRLELLYPGKHRLNIESIGEDFTAQLILTHEN